MHYDPKLMAYCGIYCDQCSFRTAFIEQDVKHMEAALAALRREDSMPPEIQCEGYKGHNICGPCKIKDCAAVKEIESCADCEQFPCDTLAAFHSDGMPHHAWAGDNLRSILQNGVARWFSSLQPALQCHCGVRQSWYYVCPEHG